MAKDLAAVTRLGIADTLQLLRERRLSAVELTQAYLARIERLEPQLGAWLTLTPDAALEIGRAHV